MRTGSHSITRHAVAGLVAVFAFAAAGGGCTTPRGVPAGANLVTEANVKSSFQAPADGMLYIFRAPARGSRGQLHYSGPILAGQTLVIDPTMNKALLDGQELDVVLPGGDVLYQAYFDSDPTVRRAVRDAAIAPGPRTTSRGRLSDPVEPAGGMRDPAVTGEGPPGGE